MKRMKSRYVGFGIVAVCFVILAVLGASIASAPSSSGNELHVRLKPPHYWGFGYRRIDICTSPSPGKVGWYVAVGPISVSHLTPWRSPASTNTSVVVTNVAAHTSGGAE